MASLGDSSSSALSPPLNQTCQTGSGTGLRIAQPMGTPNHEAICVRFASLVLGYVDPYQWFKTSRKIHVYNVGGSPDCGLLSLQYSPKRWQGSPCPPTKQTQVRSLPDAGSCQSQQMRCSLVRRIEPGQGKRYHVELRPRESWIGNPSFFFDKNYKTYTFWQSAEFPGHPSQLARLLSLLRLFRLCNPSLFFFRTWSFPVFSLCQHILCCPAFESWFFAWTATVVDETAIWTAEDLTLYNFIVPILSLPNTILKNLFCLNLTCVGLSFTFPFCPTRSRFNMVRFWGSWCLNLGILALPWSLGFGSTITRSATFQALLQDIPFAAFSAISIFAFASTLFACILLTLLPWPLLPPSLQTFALLGAHGILHGRRDDGRSFDLQRIKNWNYWNIMSAIKLQTQKIFKHFKTYIAARKSRL